MRIIAGAFKGRRLASPSWEGLRPTSDRLRETLFNVLAPRVAGAQVLDVYAGTGALGLEALSRGAAFATFIEHDRRAQRLIDQNVRLCGAGDRCAIIRAQASAALERLRDRPDFTPFDIVLLDPPYDRPPASVLERVDTMVSDQGVVVLERARRTPAPDRVGRLMKQRDLASGDSVLSWYALST